MVSLLFENLKGVMKDHQKNLKSKLQKLTPFSMFFLRLVNFPLKDLFREKFFSPFIFTPLKHLKFIEKKIDNWKIDL